MENFQNMNFTLFRLTDTRILLPQYNLKRIVYIDKNDHSFMQQVFTEHLLCARYCSSSMDTAVNKTNTPALKEVTL